MALVHSGSRPSSSVRTCATRSGWVMRSALICRMVILSASSPSDTGVWIRFTGRSLQGRQPWWAARGRQDGSAHALREHGIGDLHEAGDVGALHVVDAAILALAMADAQGMDLL